MFSEPFGARSYGKIPSQAGSIGCPAFFLPEKWSYQYACTLGDIRALLLPT